MPSSSSGSTWEIDAAGDDRSPAPPRKRSSVDEQQEAWECGIAATRGQREAAFRLIYQAYVRGGLGIPNPHALRVTPYHLLPTTTIFTASLTSGADAGEVFSTVSLIGDGAFGLPLERIYSGEVEQLRSQGLRLAEVSCLADRRHDFRRFFPVFCALNRWMIQFAQAQEVDQLLVAVHPKHARFYTRYLGFELVGGLANYPAACNRPAVALSFDFHRDHRSCPYYQNFFGDPLPREVLTPALMSVAEVEHFGRLVDPAFGFDFATAL